MLKMFLLPGLTVRRVCAILVFASFSFLFSCTTLRHTSYFENIKKDTTLQKVVSPEGDLLIRKFDKLSINISSISPELSLYMAPAAQGGFQVDQDGNIFFPKIGVIHVEGMTRTAVGKYITKEMTPFVKDPYVTVAFANHHVTVLGDVGNPQIIPMTEENLTILE